MGNRSLETYRQQQERSRSKSKSSPPKDSASNTKASPRGHRENRRQSGSSSRAQQQEGGVQVAALDERNLKRAVNRYGTMPKGARIGAYLESLRQSGMTPEPVTDQGVDSDATLDSSSQGGDTLESTRQQQQHQSSLGRSKPVSAAAAAQMLRSNSSHGGFGGGRGSPVQRSTPNNQLRRALTSGIDTPMRGATAQQMNPASDADFLPPPPPMGDGLDQLPPAPPPVFSNVANSGRPSPSPRTKRKHLANKENLPDRLKSGRNNRASDSGEDSEADRSLHSPAAVQAAAAAAALNRSTPKSPISPMSECRTLGSPAVGSLSSPGSTMDDGRMAERQNGSGHAATGGPDAIRPFNKANLELKLLDELKATSGGDGSATHSQQQGGGEEGSPAAQLVTELAESIKAKGQSKSPSRLSSAKADSSQDDSKRHEVDFKANLRKVKRPDSDQDASRVESATNPHEIDFKAGLKKTGNATAPLVTEKPPSGGKVDSQTSVSKGGEADEKSSGNIVDFKAKLKKPKPMVPVDVAQSERKEDEQINFKARLRKVSGNKPVVTIGETAGAASEAKNGAADGANKSTQKDSSKDAPEDDKRKSTGSISSLRKMWESSESPALGGRKASNASPDSQPTSPTDPSGESRSVKFEKRVWPPVPNTEMEKPMVPVKPTMKPAPPTSKPPPPTTKPPPPKPPPSAKPHPLCNIYAAPSQVTARPKTSTKPAIASKPPAPASGGAGTTAVRKISGSNNGCSGGSAGDASGDSGESSSTTDKDSILNSSHDLESKLADAARTAQLSTSTLMKLSESVGTFHSDCSSFADNVTPTCRFRFRSLLSKLEQQSQELRSGSQCIDDIHGTVKDLVTVIQR